MCHGVRAQHRAFYCYLLLTVWIFLLVAGMYKYIGSDDATPGMKRAAAAADLPPPPPPPPRRLSRNMRPDMKMRRIFRLCNPPEEISVGSEGQVPDKYTLEGVLVLVRHGDRGPLAHVRNISSVNCAGDLVGGDAGDADINFRTYELFVQNLTAAPAPAPAPGRLPSLPAQFLGPFHGFPLLPPSSGECQLGQMTPVGVAQLLKTGHVLRAAYGDRLGVGNATLSAGDLLVYSTRYRRTFQSAVAFLYAFLTPEDFFKATLRESQSLAFCFNECACPAADKYRRRFATESAEHLQAHPAVVKLVSAASTVVFEVADKTLASDPHALRDAMLAYVCHGADLPCVDVDGAGVGGGEVCVRMEQVTGLFAYTEWEARQYARSASLKRACALRAYGLLRHVVAHMLRLISEGKPRLVLYSGHDKTLLYLTTALGVLSDATATPHYASRLVLEVYKNRQRDAAPRQARDFYFRLVYNGRDLTQHVHFCKGSNSVAVPPPAPPPVGAAKRRLSSHLCPIESIVRFLHDDYFAGFNATNFKDVCTVHS